MTKFNSFLNSVYQTNYDYDQLERASRHHILIHVLILAMVFCVFVPMIISLSHNIDFSVLALPMAIVTCVIFCAFRIPYLYGKLDMYEDTERTI